MRADLKTVPNYITLLRLLSLPLLWWFAVNDQTMALGIGLALCGLSDRLDGVLARRLNQTTAFGALFDSVTDQLILVSAIVWVLMLMPEIVLDHSVQVAAALILLAATFAVSWHKFRGPPNLHLILTQISSLARYVFVILAFLFGQYNELLFQIMWVIYMLALCETLLILVTRSEVDENMKSLLHLYRQQRA